MNPHENNGRGNTEKKLSWVSLKKKWLIQKYAEFAKEMHFMAFTLQALHMYMDLGPLTLKGRQRGSTQKAY